LNKITVNKKIISRFSYYTGLAFLLAKSKAGYKEGKKTGIEMIY